VNVTVTTAGGTSATSAADQFAYVAAPTVSGVSPSAGPTAGGTTVTITGTNLSNAAAVDFGTTAVTSFTSDSATQIVLLDPAGNTGTVNVTVTTAGGTSATSSADQFTFLAAPTVSGVSPSAGPTAGGTTATITGTNLSNATAVDFGTTAVTRFTSDSATQIVLLDPAGKAGTVDVTVTTAGGTSATSSADQFTYVAAPTVSGVSPSRGPTGGGTTVTITGTNLANATAVHFGKTVASNVISDSATQIVVVSPAGKTGTVDVTVTTAGGTSATSPADRFTYGSAPKVAAVSPSAGPAAGGTAVTITGTNLLGATAVDFGTKAVTRFTSDSATQIVLVSPAGTAGKVDVTVTTSAGTSTTPSGGQFGYLAAPVLKALSPASGPKSGGTPVTISGANLAGATAIRFGKTVVSHVTSDSATKIVVVSPAGTAGTVDVTVTTAGGTSLTSPADHFAYKAAAPVPAVRQTARARLVAISGAKSKAGYLVRQQQSGRDSTELAEVRH
jgi:hypothetical protein